MLAVEDVTSISQALLAPESGKNGLTFDVIHSLMRASKVKSGNVEVKRQRGMGRVKISLVFLCKETLLPSRMKVHFGFECHNRWVRRRKKKEHFETKLVWTCFVVSLVTYWSVMLCICRHYTYLRCGTVSGRHYRRSGATAVPNQRCPDSNVRLVQGQRTATSKHWQVRHRRQTPQQKPTALSTVVFFSKRVVPKGLDHTLSVITVNLYVCVCVCNVVLTGGGVGVGTTLVPKWSVMITDHFEPMWF